MNLAQSPTGATFIRQWQIRRPIVYRYMEKQFVDRFFEDGTLRISSFSEFSKHEDEQRGDCREGVGIVSHVNHEGEGQTALAFLKKGGNAFVLCGTTRHSPELQRAFQVDSGFKINDSTAFANVVSSYIPGFSSGLEGECFYQDGRAIMKDVGAVDFDNEFKGGDPNSVDMNKMFSFFEGLVGDDLFFLKHERFSSQHEYRLLWLVPNLVEGFIDIKCPEARQFCSRIEVD